MNVEQQSFATKVDENTYITKLDENTNAPRQQGHIRCGTEGKATLLVA